jgi:hypothetical protein
MRRAYRPSRVQQAVPTQYEAHVVGFLDRASTVSYSAQSQKHTGLG